jgi:predicted MFS family arabinose efflux permease
MTDRWLILAALTFARTVMGIQFQSVVAVAPPLMASFHLNYAEFGSLIGLYLFPGVAVALPSGVLAQRFSDKSVVAAGLAAMTFGGTLMALSDSSVLLMAGRLLSGCGAVLLNVLVTKMVTDWFQGREIVTALGVLITSWPLGIALALVVLPPLAAPSSWRGAMLSVAALSALAFLLIVLFYRAPSGVKLAVPRLHIDLTRHEFVLATLSGMVWTFYNMGFILVLTFGPAWLIAQGRGAKSASAIVSVVSWVIIPALPIGGWLAERLGRPLLTMAGCFLLAVLAIWALPIMGTSVLLLTIIGFIFGPPGGLIMALPGQVTVPQRRAVAVGIYFTCYYLGMGIVPGLAGYARDATGSATAPIFLAGGMLLLALVALLLFRFVQFRAPVVWSKN